MIIPVTCCIIAHGCYEYRHLHLSTFFSWWLDQRRATLTSLQTVVVAVVVVAAAVAAASRCYVIMTPGEQLRISHDVTWPDDFVNLFVVRRHSTLLVKEIDLKLVGTERCHAADNQRRAAWSHHTDTVPQLQLHCLPVGQRVDFKIAVLVIQCLAGQAPCLSGRWLSARRWYQCSPTPFCRHGEVCRPSHVGLQ